MKIPTLILLTALFAACSNPFYQKNTPIFQFTLSIPDPASHSYHIELDIYRFREDTLTLKMPRWMPGYTRS